MNEVVLGVFRGHRAADTAVDELQAAGYDAKDISIIMKSPEDGERVAGHDDVVMSKGVVKKTKQGAITGGVIGGLAGILIGITATVMPGLGGLLLVGPLASIIGLTGPWATTVTGALTGAAAGGLIGFLMGLGIPRETSEKYEQSIKEGGVLVAVPIKKGADNKAEHILDKNGAEEIRAVSAQA